MYFSKFFEVKIIITCKEYFPCLEVINISVLIAR